MHREHLLDLLKAYRTSFANEAAFKTRITEFVLEHETCFERSEDHGHLTGSAWIVNQHHDHVILMHHKKLNRWFQPGGHADGEHNMFEVARREAMEETGLALEDIKPLSESIFDVDVHAIPESDKEHRHEHFDVRFLFQVDDQLAIPGNNESHQIGWVPLDDIKRFNNNLSTHRMAEKTRRL